jgi:ketosteroid isomerase-like protein
MRCVVYGGLFAILITSTAAAQAKPGVAGAPGATGPKPTFAEIATMTVTKLEDSWANALVRRDRSTFERLLAPKFVYTEDTTTMDRATVLRGMFTDVVTEAHNDSMEVHLFGNTAVVTGWLVTKGHNKDGPFDHRYRFTDVWMPRSGSWQIVAAQDYLVPIKK